MVCNYRVGSSFPPCSIACFDEYENQIPFTSVPSLEVELKASDGFQVIIDNDKIEASLIDGILKVEVFNYYYYSSTDVMTMFLLLRAFTYVDYFKLMQNILIETDGLNQIRPGYNAILEIRSKDEPFSVTGACKGKLNGLILYRNSLHLSVLQKIVARHT